MSLGPMLQMIAEDRQASAPIDEVLRLSCEHRQRGRHDLSRDLLRRALRTDDIERRINFLSDLGCTEAHAGRYDAAIIHYRKSLELMPDFTPSLYQLGSLLAAQGKWNEANEIFSRDIPVVLGDGGVTTTATIRF